MDWQRMSSLAAHAETLDRQALDTYLTGLRSEDPELATRLMAHVKRRRNARSFMQTSVPGEAEPATAEYLGAGAEVGVWKIDRLIGEGGMGEVYLAHRNDGLYDQDVALKLMRGGDPLRQQRFEAERKQLARMDHPGISGIIDGGETEDHRPFMAMEYVEGAPVDTWCETRNLSRRERLKLVRDLCGAVSHAHGKLVLHRDIKCTNVLVDSGGHVRLIDFGVASLMDDQDEDGSGPLTFAYAAPEQLEAGAVSVQTDIFAIGCLMHVLLTGSLPARQPDGGVSIDTDRIASDDLSAIVAKATALTPEERYAHVNLIGEDIDSYLTHRPVRARNGGRLYRMLCTLKRYPLASGFAAAFVLALVAGLTSSLMFARHAQAEADRAGEELARAEYYLNRASTNYRAQSAYADALQLLFGGDADVERMTETLLEHWREAHAARDEAPDQAALISFAVGRHFLFRNDYQSALEVLETWLSEPYGPEPILERGYQLLPIVYDNLGRSEDALIYLRKVEASLAGGFDANSADHVAAATRIAILTRDPADARHAEEILMKAMESEADIHAPIRLFFWNQLSFMRRIQGDLEGGYEAMRKVVDVIDESPLIEISEHGRVLMNLASYEHHYRHDTARAGELANFIATDLQAAKGESLEGGAALVLLGLIANEQGEPGAVEMVRKGREQINRFSGAQSPRHVFATTALVRLLADSEAYSEASALMDAMQDTLGDLPASDPRQQQLNLSETYLIAARDGVRAARQFAADATIDLTAIHMEPDLVFLYNQLADRGVVDPLQGSTSN